MNSAALFSILYLAIVAAAGLVNDVPAAWVFAAATAALAFFAHQFAEVCRFIGVANGLALASWVTGALAGLALLV